jgi:hypothetical protein
MIYKVSYVVIGPDRHPGAIMNEYEMPKPGDKVEIGDRVFVVREVLEMTPPRGDFQYLHATVVPQEQAEEATQ